MHTIPNFDSEREDELFNLDKTIANTTDNKKTKPHLLRRSIEDYLEKKALEKRLKDVFEEQF